jgi:hypothetical protein
MRRHGRRPSTLAQLSHGHLRVPHELTEPSPERSARPPRRERRLELFAVVLLDAERGDAPG